MPPFVEFDDELSIGVTGEKSAVYGMWGTFYKRLVNPSGYHLVRDNSVDLEITLTLSSYSDLDSVGINASGQSFNLIYGPGTNINPVDWAIYGYSYENYDFDRGGAYINKYHKGSFGPIIYDSNIHSSGFGYVEPYVQGLYRYNAAPGYYGDPYRESIYPGTMTYIDSLLYLYRKGFKGFEVEGASITYHSSKLWILQFSYAPYSHHWVHIFEKPIIYDVGDNINPMWDFDLPASFSFTNSKSYNGITLTVSADVTVEKYLLIDEPDFVAWNNVTGIRQNELLDTLDASKRMAITNSGYTVTSDKRKIYGFIFLRKYRNWYLHGQLPDNTADPANYFQYGGDENPSAQFGSSKEVGKSTEPNVFQWAQILDDIPKRANANYWSAAYRAANP